MTDATRREADPPVEGHPRPEAGLGKSLGLMGSASAVAFGTGIVRQKLFAVFLGPSGFGVYAVLASFYEWVSTLTLMGAPTGLLREASPAMRAGDRGRVADLVSIVRKALLPVSLLLVLLTAVLSPYLASRFGVPYWWPVLVTLGLPAAVVAATSDTAINAVGAVRRLALSKMLTSLLSLGVMAVLVALFGLLGAILQIVTGAVIGAAMSFAFLRGLLRVDSGQVSKGAALDSRVVLKVVFAVGLAQTIVHAASTLNLFAFRAMLLLQLGDVQSGLYQAAMGLSRQYYSAFSAGLFVYLYPALSSQVADRRSLQAEIARAFRLVLAAGVPIALVLLASRDLLIKLVLTEEFLRLVPLMIWTIPADVFHILLGVLRIAVLATAAPRAFVVLGLGFEVVYLVSFVLGVQVAGLAGAVAAYSLATGIGLLLFGGHLARRGLLPMTSDMARRLFAAFIVLAGAAILPLGTVMRIGLLSVAGLWLYLDRRALRSAFS